MTQLVRVVWSWGLATADFLFAFFGVAAFVYPTLSLVAEVLPPSAPTIPVAVLTSVLASGARYPYVAGGWSLARLDALPVRHRRERDCVGAPSSAPRK